MSSMLTNWISKGAQVITNSAKSITQNNPNVADTNAIVKEVLTRLQISLSKQLGQNCEGMLQSIGSDVLQQKQLEKTLIQTKQKYHQLVAQCESQNQSIKIMMQNIIQFMRNLCNSLKNQDMLTPLKDLQSAFYLCNTSKVDKQIKYFWKLYEAALDDHVKVCVNSKQDQCKDQINLFKGLNKNLQVELFRSRNNCVDLQKRVNQLHSKNQQISDKLSILQKLGAESALLASSKQKQKADQRQNQLLQKIKALQRQKIKLERKNKQYENQVVKSTSAIQVIKSNQDNIIEEMKRQIKKKQSAYQASMSKVCAEKIVLEDKIRNLNIEFQNLKQEAQGLKQRQVSPKKDHKTAEIKQLNQRLKELEEDNEASKRKMDGMVSKQMMKVLFLGYEDESKEWTIRRDVKNQIYLLLDVKPKINTKSEKNTQDKKWFGIF